MTLTRMLAIGSIAIGAAAWLLTTRRGAAMRGSITQKSIDLTKRLRNIPLDAKQRMHDMSIDGVEIVS